MPSAELMRGEPVAATVREAVRERVSGLSDQGVVPTLATVLVSDDPKDQRFMDLKHAACADLDIATRDVRLDSTAPPREIYRVVDDLSTDPGVHAVFIQYPLPDHVERSGVCERLDPQLDVDCLHPESRGRLVTGDPRFVPATSAAVLRLFETYNIQTKGQDIVVVGRSTTIGTPLANRLLYDAPHGNATVTVCHSHTRNLGEKIQKADIIVTACGVPELVDGSMLSSGVVCVDVSANWRESDSHSTDVVGDIEFESAREKASAITPVPGGVGPVTLAMLLSNVVRATDRQT